LLNTKWQFVDKLSEKSMLSTNSNSHSTGRFLWHALVFGLSLSALQFATTVMAREEVWQGREDSVLWRTECSACHVAYPPALLPVDDWLLIMSELNRHFGSDASLDAKTVQEISAFLSRNGSARRSVGGPDELPRISSADWFFRRHKSAFRLLSKGKIKSVADCTICHKGPEIDRMTGNY
jgi:hypothetical protein